MSLFFFLAIHVVNFLLGVWIVCVSLYRNQKIPIIHLFLFLRIYVNSLMGVLTLLQIIVVSFIVSSFWLCVFSLYLDIFLLLELMWAHHACWIKQCQLFLFIFLTIHVVNFLLVVWIVCVLFVLEVRDSTHLLLLLRICVNSLTIV